MEAEVILLERKRDKEIEKRKDRKAVNWRDRRVVKAESDIELNYEGKVYIMSIEILQRRDKEMRPSPEMVNIGARAA